MPPPTPLLAGRPVLCQPARQLPVSGIVVQPGRVAMSARSRALLYRRHLAVHRRRASRRSGRALQQPDHLRGAGRFHRGGRDPRPGESMFAQLEALMHKRGVLEAQQMGSAFAALRSGAT